MTTNVPETADRVAIRSRSTGDASAMPGNRVGIEIRTFRLFNKNSMSRLPRFEPALGVDDSGRLILNSN
jgi:hypothetical protein